MQNLPVQIENSILWGNDGQVGGNGGIAPESTNNIIQGLPGGFDPLFILNPDPGEGGWANTATNNYGNLRLQTTSPAVDAGANPAAPTSLDLGGNPRIQNSTIDIGPYEGYRDDYSYLFGHLEPEDDANSNGRPNYEDYARGSDPSDPHESETMPQIRVTGDGLELVFTERINREDIFVQWQRSSSLQPNSWVGMEENIDYAEITSSNNGTRTRSTFKLLSNESGEPVFYRQIFNQTQP